MMKFFWLLLGFTCMSRVECYFRGIFIIYSCKLLVCWNSFTKKTMLISFLRAHFNSFSYILQLTIAMTFTYFCNNALKASQMRILCLWTNSKFFCVIFFFFIEFVVEIAKGGERKENTNLLPKIFDWLFQCVHNFICLTHNIMKKEKMATTAVAVVIDVVQYQIWEEFN